MLRHRWDLTTARARQLQDRLREEVVEIDDPRPVRLVAGADIAVGRGDLLYAAVVVLDAATLEPVEQAIARGPARFPYVPGHLSFRELPLLLKAFGKLRHGPDLVICDGQGRAHPRRFGLACHYGLWLDLPTIGCGKSRLIGTYRMPGERRGCHRRLLDRGEVIGEVVRTRDGVKPVFVSVGHRITVPTARRWILRLAPRYRIPEPIRAAHQLAERERHSDEATKRTRVRAAPANR